MTKLKREKLKTAILLLLIITSMIQMGIHWNQQNQGFPFPFISGIFNPDKSSNANHLMNQYFNPESIIVTVSPTSPRWKLDQNDSYYNSIWEDVRDHYLPALIDQKPVKTITKEQWLEITDTRCVLVNFAANWPSDIISGIMQYSKTGSGDLKNFNSVKAIAVLPETDINGTVNGICVYDGTQAYLYSVNIKASFLPKSFYKKIADELSAQNKPGLSVLTSVVTNFESPEDILVSLNRTKGNSYPALKLTIPASIVVKQENIENSSIQDKILLNEKDSFMPEYNATTGEAIFSDTENIYKLFANGTLEYKYLPSVKEEAGKASAAFSKALSFIELRRNLLGNVEIVLTGITKRDNYYELNFDYKYQGTKVFYTGTDLNGRISSPLTIKVNSERVLECKWVIRSITEAEKPKLYSVYFGDLINDQIPSSYPEIIIRKYFERIEPGYVFSSGQEDKPIYPDWIISTDSKDYYIPLKPEGGK